MLSWFLGSRKNKDKAYQSDGGATDDCIYVDPPQFNLPSLMAATGDLGPVYKCELADGQVAAVRRLPASYWQSFQIHELKDELMRAAKLKHDNIVQILGIYLDPRDKLLVYEYLPNASLDTILFDTERRQHLDWEKRYSIIRGIARGLLYLHEQSGLGINQYMGILRPSKVLLDNDMNPKILDAGIPPPNTGDNCVIWPYSTRRYAAPEWFMTPQTITTKSDMFSFGVILLETVTGRGMYYDWCNGNISQNGISYIWDKWKAGWIADIADASLGHRYPRNEMRACVHIGLLCLQQDHKLRPDASAVMQGNIMRDVAANSLHTISCVIDHLIYKSIYTYSVAVLLAFGVIKTGDPA